MDTEWALAELRTFVELTTLVNPAPTPGVVFLGDDRYPKGREKIAPAAQVVEQILGRVLPTWRTDIAEDTKKRWQQHREAAKRAIAQLEREDELREKLGDNAALRI